MYKCEIIADSVSPQRDRLTTFKVTYPRIIHAEMCRHRMMSRNTASSRAIPFEKMVKDVQEDPFIPIAWQKNHKGMQGSEYLTGLDRDQCEFEWLSARDGAVEQAQQLNMINTTKQLCNRLLEPFVWTTELITTSEEGLMNFFELRCPKYKLFGLGSGPQKSRKDWLRHMQFSSSLHPLQYPKTEEEWWSISESSAEIHIQKIAEMMFDCYNESKPKTLQSGEWHIPYGDISMSILEQQELSFKFPTIKSKEDLKCRIATARAARISYTTLGDNPKIDYEADIKLHDRLLESKHLSCFEHNARAMNIDEYSTFIKGKCEVNPYTEEVISPVINQGYCNNFKGFIQYRYLVENK